MITIIGYPDYVDGYIRSAHFELEISDEIQKELDIRLRNLEDGKSELYSWEAIKAHLKTIR